MKLPSPGKDVYRFPFPLHVGLYFELDLKTNEVHHHSTQNLLLNNAIRCRLALNLTLNKNDKFCTSLIFKGRWEVGYCYIAHSGLQLVFYLPAPSKWWNIDYEINEIVTYHIWLVFYKICKKQFLDTCIYSLFFHKIHLCCNY